MEESPNLDNIQQVNKDMLSQSPTIGGVINTAAFDPIIFAPQEPSQIVPQKYSPTNINAPTPKAGEDDFESALGALEDNNYVTKDANTKYGGVGAYDADYTGIYYDRYADMKNVFNKYGFSPWRDNEALYNKNSTWTDNFKRSLNNSMSLAGISFKGALPWNAWSSDISKEDAIEQERAFARGYDSRGGFGSFMNNQVLNSGFTVGILAEFGAEALVEGAIGLVAAPETGGASLALFGDIARKGYQAIKAIDKGIDVAKVGQRIAKSAEALKDINVSRKFYNAINAERIGKALTPNLVDEILEIQKMSRAGESLTGLAKVSRGAGAFYKDMRIAAAAVAESKMEAGSVELKIRDEITQEFFNTNGRMPNADEQAALAIKAHEGAMSTFWYNLPAIYLSNKIVFDKAFSSIKPMRLSADALENATRRYGIEMTEAGFKEYQKGVRASVSRMASANFWKPKNLTKNVLVGLGKYTKANVTEGLQEQYQEGVSDAFTNYYRDQYFNPFTTGTKLSYLTTGMSKQFTTQQGWETFASGFMMGGMMQGPQHLVFTKGSDLSKRVFQKEKYQKAKEQEKETVAQMVNALNEVDGFIKKYSKGEEHANAAVQIRNSQDLATATEKQNKKAYIDIVDDSMANHFYTLAATGKLSVIQDQISDYMKMSPDELRQAFGIEETGDAAVEKANKKLSEMMTASKDIEARYKAVDSLYYNPFNPMRYNPKTEPEKFQNEIINKTAFEQAKKFAVMSGYHYDKTVARMNSLYNNAANTPVANALAQDFQALYGTDKNVANEIHNLKAEIKAMSESVGLSPLDRKSLSAKKKKLEALEEFSEVKAHYETVLQGNDQKAQESAVKDLYKAYKKYATAIATGVNEPVFDNKLEASFRDLLDFYSLGDDKSHLAQSVNILNNPEGLMYMAQRIAKQTEQLENNRQEELAKALEKFKEYAVTNATLSKLLDLGLFIDEPEMNDLFEGKEVTKFYEMGNKNTPLDAKSDKYLKAIEIVQAYRLEKGFITPETIEEEQQKEEELVPPSPEKVETRAEVQTEESESQPLKDDVKSLLKKGFKQSFIDTLSPAEIDDIFKNNLTQVQVQAKRVEAEVEAKDAEIKAAQKERQKLTERFVADIESADDAAELDAFMTEISTYSLDSYNFETVEAVAKKKMGELKDQDYKNKQVTFDKLNNGDLVYLRKEGAAKTYVIVKLKDGFKIHLEGTDPKSAQTVYSPEDAPKLILAKAGMVKEEVTTEVSKEAKEAAEQNLNVIQEITKEAKQKKLKEDKNKSSKDLFKNIKNKKGC